MGNYFYITALVDFIEHMKKTIVHYLIGEEAEFVYWKPI